MAEKNAHSEAKPKTQPPRLRSAPLAGVLSATLVLAWLVYLVVAPDPSNFQPPPPLAEQEAAVSEASAPEPPDTQLRVLLWRNVLGPDALSEFESESGLTVVAERYNTFQDLTSRLDSGSFNYDVVIASGMGMPAMIERGVLQPLPDSSIQGTGGLNPAVVDSVRNYDSDLTYTVPLLWGTLGLSFDRMQAAQRLDADIEIDSWSFLFDPLMAGKFADCGVQVVDAPGGVFAVALSYLGLPHDSPEVEDTDAAAQLWEGVRSSIRKFSTSDIVDGLSGGQICMGMTASGDAYQAALKSRESGAARDIAYVIPKESTVVWHAVAALPTAARTERAGAFISYLLRPEVAARITNATGFSSAVTDANLYVKPEIKNNPAMSPAFDSLENAVLEKVPSPAGASLRQKFWQLINAPAQPASEN